MLGDVPVIAVMVLIDVEFKDLAFFAESIKVAVHGGETYGRHADFDGLVEGFGAGMGLDLA
jgi:hypothetical protein